MKFASEKEVELTVNAIEKIPLIKAERNDVLKEFGQVITKANYLIFCSYSGEFCFSSTLYNWYQH